MHKNSTSLIGLVALAAMFFAINLISGTLFKSARLDLTDAKLFTLSQGTKNILAKIEDPVTLRLFYSKKLAAEKAPGLERYAQRVTELLDEYEAHSAGKLKIIRIDPQPFSEEEDKAVEFGMQGMPVNTAGEKVYFGLAGTNTTDEEERIPFIELPRENFLEYDFSKLVYSLAFPKKSRVGLLSSLPLGGSPANPMTGQPAAPPWFFVDQLRSAFDVLDIERRATELPADVDLLVLVHPKELAPDLLFDIDQFVLGGGKLLAFLDPHCESDTEGINPQDQMSAFSANRTSDIGPLSAAWGFELVAEKLAGDRRNAERVAMDGGDSPYPIWLNLPGENFDSDDPVTAELKKIRMATAGVLNAMTGASTEFQPLIWTSSDSMEVDRMKVVMGHSPQTVQAILDDFLPIGGNLTLAARIGGTASSAYPDGPPEPVVAEGAAAPPMRIAPEGGWLSEGPVQLIVVADADMLGDRWWVRISNFLGQRIAQPNANNSDLVINALDNLSGNEDLISLRSREGFERPFTRVEKMRDEADERFRAEESELQAKMDEAQAKIDALQKDQEGAVGSLILSPEVRAEIENYREQQNDTRKKLRDVKHSLTKDIDSLGATLKLVHIIMIPMGIGILALAFAAARMNSKRN